MMTSLLKPSRAALHILDGSVHIALAQIDDYTLKTYQSFHPSCTTLQEVDLEGEL